MNRYDAIEDIKYTETYTEQINVINSIFDHFESRTCESCKLNTYLECPCWDYNNGKPSISYCSEWESKR
jgi:hypothetical protein